MHENSKGNGGNRFFLPTSPSPASEVGVGLHFPRPLRRPPMAISAAAAAVSFGRATLLPPLPHPHPHPHRCRRRRPRLAASSRRRSPPSPDDANPRNQHPELLQYHALPPPLPRSARAAPVFVALPEDSVGPDGAMRRSKVLRASFAALVTAGVEGIVMEVWWGIVEREAPRVYDWRGFLDVVALANRHGLKVRVILAFHQCGQGPGDPLWIPLPPWVLEEMEKEPNISYSDRFGRRNREYVSLGCDLLPVLDGRTPIQTYSDFMREFKKAFEGYLGIVITDVQIGMGPGGELRYPSYSSRARIQELGEFQCYDKFMLASLNACARKIGMREWGDGGPIGASNLMQNPERTAFFKSDGAWNTPYGEFFLEWYSRMLLLHGERLCMAADTIFLGTGVNISAKVAGIHWHYGTKSHPSELTAGYYNTSLRDGYIPIAQLLARYRMTLCCTCFDLLDTEEGESKPSNSPEGFLRQLIFAAREFGVPMTGENSGSMNDSSMKQVIRNSRFYWYGGYKQSFSFNFLRMGRHLFDARNWAQFTRFVKQMSDTKTFQAKLDFGRSELCLSSSEEACRRAFAYY